MSSLLQDIPKNLKKSSASFLLFLLKLLSGVFLGLTFALAGEEIVGYEGFAFWFVLIMFTGIFLRVSKNWKFGGTIIFNLIFVLMALLFRMYVLMAPGA